MNRSLIIVLTALFAALAGLGVVAEPLGSVEGLLFSGTPVTAEQVGIGQEVYQAKCASCHGTALEGQPDWKRRLPNGRMPAPPHDASGHTWHHSDNDLFAITKGGVESVLPGYESDMPAFGDALSDEEIRAVLAYIKSTWPEKSRKFQAAVSAQDGD